jgi:hypothetical protein
MKTLVFLLFIFLVRGSLDCTYECDDPVCPATCEPLCKPYNCSFICPHGRVCDEKPDCEVSCNNTGADPSSECPLCEVQCDTEPPQSCPHCSVLCAEIECGWGECAKPFCTPPLCQLQCPRPACEFVAAGRRLTLF